MKGTHRLFTMSPINETSGVCKASCILYFVLPINTSSSNLEGSSTSVGRPGNGHSPIIAVENVDVGQPILLDISSDGVRVSEILILQIGPVTSLRLVLC